MGKSNFKPRKFKAIIDEFGLDDGGTASFTFEVQSLKKGEIYLERDPDSLSPPHNKGVVIDDNCCWWYIGKADFNKRFKEIK